MTAAPPDSTRPPGPFSLLGLSIVATVLAIDQTAKAISESRLDYQQLIDLLPVLSLFHVHNTGVAFSFARGLDSLVLVGGTGVITLAVLWLWASAKDGGRLVGAGFALITGGALGNLIDRIRLGYVEDYLYLHIGSRGLFVFNLADVALTLGPILLAWHYLVGGRKG